ncbi:MAG: thiamine diphosphokinase [Candidatus Zixiibacteriota bacterium]|nr:MAG: thiamine diphosphokinase [candidate division Zixibacteria bacterium]
MRRCGRHILFLNNRYYGKDNGFHLGLLKGKYSIAVDGGIRFFLRNKIHPDVLVGDLDSAPRLAKHYVANFEVIMHPSAKDKTDSHLALELSLERGAESIDICGAVGRTEMDHTLGNIFLLDIVNKFNRAHKRNVSVRIVSPAQELYLVDNGCIELKGRTGDHISVIPLSDEIRLKLSGLVYPAPKKPVKFGDSLTLRNMLRGGKCRIDVSGRAVVVWLTRS